LDLDVLTWGAGHRRILLLHGLSSSAAGWWRLAADLAERGWAVTAPDLRGHGGSPAGDDYRFDSYATDIAALGTGWDAVLGHSLGAAVAVTAATADPDWSAGLVLQDPALMVVEAGRDEIAGWLLDAYEPPVTAGRVAEQNPRWHPEDCRIKADALQSSGPEMVLGTLSDNDPWNLLAEAAVPPAATVVLGSDPAEGGILAITVGEWLADRPGVDYHMLAGAGHSAHRYDDLYDTYLAAVLGALEALPSLAAELEAT
jgi:pimeloyl-ACP methyl ester carboxylesterase